MKSLRCPACGANIEIDDTREFGFCQYCGTKIMLHEVVEIRERPASSTVQFADGMKEATKIKEHFDSVANTYRKVDKLTAECRTLDNQKYTGLFVLGGIVTGAGLLCFGSSVFMAILMFFIVGPGLLALGFWKTKRLSQEKENKKNELTNLKNVLAHHYNEFKNCPIGFEYTHPDRLEPIYNYIRQGRAYTIKEAINMYEEQIYKNKMQQIALNTQRATLQMQQEQRNHMNNNR